MSRGYMLVEGHGEARAAGNLVHRLSLDLGLAEAAWAAPSRWPKLHREDGLRRACRVIAAKCDADRLLLLRDEDDACPAQTAPLAARWIAEERLSFPVAIVLFHREYETLFLAVADQLAGRNLIDDRHIERPGLTAGVAPPARPEEIRDAKGWLSRQFPPGRIYKPTIDQLPLTRLLDLRVLRERGLPCFGSLERALRFLSMNAGKPGVYPPPAPSESQAS